MCEEQWGAMGSGGETGGSDGSILGIYIWVVPHVVDRTKRPFEDLIAYIGQFSSLSRFT